jgi:hypothetical protein
MRFSNSVFLLRKKEAGIRTGFKNPRGTFPLEMRKSLRRAMIDAKVHRWPGVCRWDDKVPAIC